MPPTTSLSPIPSRAFSPAHAWHLLSRVGFGGSAQSIAQTHRLGLSRAVDQLVNYQQVPADDLPGVEIDPDTIRPRTRQERDALARARRDRDQDTIDRYNRDRNVARAEDRRMHLRLQAWWAQRMIQTPRPAQEKLTLLWHSHFATRHRDLRDSYLMYQQNQMFRTHANGSFAALAGGIVRDPAMIHFLNNNRNIARRPNENLARELMELFTLGEGNYTENDIREGARALTGYTVRDNDFHFARGSHDLGRKTILGAAGWWDGDDFVQLLLRQEACARFVALKLYRHFVADVTDDWEVLPARNRRVVQQLADLLKRSEFQVAPVLTRLFKSRHFYDPQIIGQKIKSPAHLVAGAARAMRTPERDGRTLVRLLRAMGQDLFEPPSVAGWGGGRAWINTSTLLLRQNACAYLVVGHENANARRRQNSDYDPMVLFEDVEVPEPRQAVDHLCDLMLGPHVTAERRALLYRFMDGRAEVSSASVTALLLLITAMPEYQLC